MNVEQRSSEAPQVFISFKNLDQNGKTTRDSELAREVHDFLVRKGLRVFFSNSSLEEMGTAAFKKAIDTALDAASVLIAVGTSAANLESQWVRYEWDGFQGDILSGGKPDGRIFGYVENVQLSELPRALRQNQVFERGSDALERLYKFTANALGLSQTAAAHVWSGRDPNVRDIFVSRGWRGGDGPFADAVCKGLCARKWKSRLVGDAPDQEVFSPERIRDILSACCGHLLILPRRASGNAPTDYDYRYLIRELAISRELGMPALMLAEADTPLPASLAEAVHRVLPGDNFLESWVAEPPEWLEEFLGKAQQPVSPQHIFLAAEFKENMDRVARLRAFIEDATGLTCFIGRDFEGQGLRRRIMDQISSATAVFANIANFDEAGSGSTGVNLNTCVEAGIAIGALLARGKKEPPVFLTVQSPVTEKGKTVRLPFMFQDAQITYYATEMELLEHCRRLLAPYRRRIINDEVCKLA